MQANLTAKLFCRKEDLILTTDYRDDTALTDVQKASLVGLATAIRTKMYGKDVREAIASAIEMVGVPGVNSYFTPKGVLANLAELQSKYPNGTDGIYITEDDGYWCYWNGSAWQKGQLYQAPKNPDKSIDLNILSGNYNIANSNDSTIFYNKKVDEFQDKNVVMQDYDGLEVVKYTLDKDADRIEIPFQGLSESSIFMLGYFSSDDDITKMIKFDSSKLVAGTASSISGLVDIETDRLVIFQKNYNRVYNTPLDHIYVTIPTNGEIYKFKNLLTDLELIDGKIDSNMLINPNSSLLINRVKLNQFNIQLSAGSIIGADVSGNVQVDSNANQKYAVISDVTSGILVVPFYPDFAIDQFVCLTDDSGKIFYRTSYSNIHNFSDVTLTRFFFRNSDSPELFIVFL